MKILVQTWSSYSFVPNIFFIANKIKFQLTIIAYYFFGKNVIKPF